MTDERREDEREHEVEHTVMSHLADISHRLARVAEHQVVLERLITDEATASAWRLTALQREIAEMIDRAVQLITNQLGPRPTPHGGTLYMNLLDTDEVIYTVALGPDAAGNAATEPNPLAWTVDTPSVTGTFSADGLTATFAAGPLGTATITVAIPLADGTTETLTDAIVVIAGQPTSATLTAGTPTPKAVTPPAPTPGA